MLRERLTMVGADSGEEGHGEEEGPGEEGCGEGEADPAHCGEEAVLRVRMVAVRRDRVRRTVSATTSHTPSSPFNPGPARPSQEGLARARPVPALGRV